MRSYLVILALVLIGYAAAQMVDFRITWGERGMGAYPGGTLSPEEVAESERRAVEAARKAEEAVNALRAVERQAGRD
ncbi:hypothetical protein [Paracoccus siganidrum]|uniref:hypothetical protein n=1 Tax=Paracoccus siganidrum TaxID=1276757 RepID=UPI000E734BA2|nr:hypothetical protein [Paracoccus siganidrum]RMC40987.1 hypothetical protein C9E82_00125 [Paracoccus siganidrum]